MRNLVLLAPFALSCVPPFRSSDSSLTSKPCPPFRQVLINEVRSIRTQEPADREAGEFLELKGPPGTDLSGWSLTVNAVGKGARRIDFPSGAKIGEGGFFLVGPAEKVPDGEMEVEVHLRACDGECFPAGPGVRIELRDAVNLLDVFVYASKDVPGSWLPGRISTDPLWSVARLGVGTPREPAPVRVMSASPGRDNPFLGESCERLPDFVPYVSEFMPNTNNFSDEGSFVEISAPAGLKWNALPGRFSIASFRSDGPPPGSFNHRVVLAGTVPPDGIFVVSDARRFTEGLGAGEPDQVVGCGDLVGARWECAGKDASRWNWLDNFSNAGVRLEYESGGERIILDSLRHSPRDDAGRETLYAHGEGFPIPFESSPAVSFARLAAPTGNGATDFIEADPSPGRPNERPSQLGQLRSRYGSRFLHAGRRPDGWNGKIVLFDQTKHQKAGRTGHWIVTEDGDYTDFAWQLHSLGFEVRAVGTGEVEASETLRSADLRDVSVLVVPEPQAKYDADETSAVKDFLAQGGALFFLANHMNSDRDRDGIDSWAVWNGSLGLAALTGIRLAKTETVGENVRLHPHPDAADHPILKDVEVPGCKPAEPGCRLTERIAARRSGVDLFSGAFLEPLAQPARGVRKATPLLTGIRPLVARDPQRLSGYGASSPSEVFAVAVELSSGGKIVLLGDSAVLNDGGSSDYATYAASMAYNAYGTASRNALFGLNAVRWLAGLPAVGMDDVVPTLEQAAP